MEEAQLAQAAARSRSMLVAVPINFRKGNQRGLLRSLIHAQLLRSRRELVQVVPKKRPGRLHFRWCSFHEVSLSLEEAASPPFPTPRASKSFRARRGRLSEVLFRLGLG